MLQIFLNTIASIAVVLQYLLEHFIEQKRRRKYLGFVIMTFAILGVWGSYSFQREESSGVRDKFDSIIKQYDSLTILSREMSSQLRNRDETIQEIRSQNDSLRRKVSGLASVAPKLDPTGRIQLSPGVSLASDFETGASRAKDLFNKGQFDDAYKIAEELSKKNSDFGLAYFIMGTIEGQKQNYPKAIPLLQKSIRLGLTKEDESWAYHNLALLAVRQDNLLDAVSYLEKALAANPNMKESKEMLDKINQYLHSHR